MLSTYYETLDTPAFGDSALNDLRQKATALSIEQAPVFVVAAHHNLLPQAQPRLAPYGELVNAGQVRNLLLGFRRPVVYLHGHIHADPVEIIQHPRSQDALLISISAPELRAGFNVIEILFNPGGRPFGCVVRRFRTSDGGKIAEIDPLQVPFHRHARQAMNPLNARIMSCVFAATKPLYFPDLIRGLGDQGGAPPDEDVAQAVRELIWSSLIIVANDQAHYRDWRIEKPL